MDPSGMLSAALKSSFHIPCNFGKQMGSFQLAQHLMCSTPCYSAFDIRNSFSAYSDNSNKAGLISLGLTKNKRPFLARRQEGENISSMYFENSNK